MAELSRMAGRPSIDYTARDYDSILAEMRALIPERLREWTDFDSEADVGTVLLELFAHMGDVLSYYQDRIANESFLTTARTRRSAIQHLRLIGYELGTAAPAATTLTIAVPAPTQSVTIHRGDAFATRSEGTAPSIRFEYNGPTRTVSSFTLDAQGRKTFQLDVEEGRLIDGERELLGTSDESPDQRFPLPHSPLILHSHSPSANDHDIVVTTVKQGHVDQWTRRETLAFSHAGRTADGSVTTPLDYVIEIDEDDQATVVFGDGVLGAIPPRGADVRATYRAGGGAAGNVKAGAIVTVLSGDLARIGASVIAHPPATGGVDHESIESAVRQAPAVFRSLRRAVTVADYEALALQLPGVAKVRAQPANWNRVRLYVAPDGGGSVSDVLDNQVRAYFEDKRPLSILVEVAEPTYPMVAVTVTVGVLPYYSQAATRQQVEAAAGSLLAFDEVDFGTPVYLSRFYEVIEALDAVEFANVTEFRRTDLSPDPKNPAVKVKPNGVLEFQAHEIPQPTNAKGYVGGILVVPSGGF